MMYLPWGVNNNRDDHHLDPYRLPQYQTGLVADCSPWNHTPFPDPSEEILARQLNM